MDFNEIISYLKNGELVSKPRMEIIKATVLRHLQMLAEFKGEHTAVREMRKHIAWYIKGAINAASIRNQVNKIEDIDELKSFIEHNF